MTTRTWSLVGAAALALLGCEEKSTQTEAPQAGSAGAAVGSAATETPDGPASARPKVELLAKAIERRLHPDRVESSSFLWNDWNRFQENYHPTYLIDDDPKTAWVEGADGDGVGEWVRVHLTEVAEATAIRVRLRNGYHKSKSLHKKNGRVKGLVVTALPSGEKKELDLADDMAWQTVSFSQAAGPLEALELEVASIYKGSKYADLCISDLEVFVTSRTPENPAFEKRKFEAVQAWKAERLEAAKLFASEAAKSMPIGAAYRVVGKKTIAKVKLDADPLVASAQIAGAAAKHLKSSTVARAKAAFDGKFKDWVPVSVSVKGGRTTPPVDGLYRPEAWEIGLGGQANSDGFALPAPNKVEFLTSSRLSAFESSEATRLDRALKGSYKNCKREEKRHFFYFRPPAAGAKDGVIRQLLVVECGQMEERDGFYGYAGPQLLEYDDSGRLVATVTSNSVTTFDWSTGPSPKIVGGARVRAHYGPSFFTDRLEARKN